MIWFFALQEDEPNLSLVGRVSQQIIDGRKVEVHLPRVLGLERPHLDVDDEKASKLQVIKEEIDSIVFAADFKRVLTADECEPVAELEKCLAEVRERFALPAEEPALDLHYENVAAPAVWIACSVYQMRSPASFTRSKSLMLWPQGNFATACCKIGSSGLGKRPHISEVPGREPLHVREARFEILREPRDDVFTPPFVLLPA
jgi:hypothetical protein